MAELAEKEQRGSFDGWVKVIFLAGMLVFAFHASTRMVAAGDTWVAMACGRHFDNHKVDTVEPFSANSHKAGPTQADIEKWPGWAQSIAGKFDIETVQKWHPTGWVNQNWLTHLTFYKLASFGQPEGQYNYNALIWWKFAINFIAAFCVYYTARLIGASVPASAMAGAMAMFIGRSFLDVRPAGYANLLVAIYLLVLALTIYKDHRWIWLAVPITVFWANVHGGYIYVFIMMVPLVGLNLLANLPRKWTVVLYSFGAMGALYYMSCKFLQEDAYANIQRAITREIYTPPGTIGGALFWLLLILMLVGLFFAFYKKINFTAACGYCIFAGVLFILILSSRYMISVPGQRFNKVYEEMLNKIITGSQWGFMSVTALLAVLGCVMAGAKEKLRYLNLRQLLHTIGAAIAAFIAMVIFNPFKLTNLTHTFEISLSKHAESWRRVNEWHSAFEWVNPVGVSFPFLIMLLAAVCAFVLWVLGMRFRSEHKIVNTKKNRKKQAPPPQKLPGIWTTLYIYLAIVLCSWVIMVGFSFIDIDPVSFIFCALFIVILLLSITKSIHFIYMVIPFILLGLQVADTQNGYEGRYIYPFILIPAFAILHAFAPLLSPKKTLSKKNVCIVLGVAIVSLLLMLAIYNPFKSESFFERLAAMPGLDRRPWRPAIEGKNAFPYTYLFPVLCFVNIAALLGMFLKDQILRLLICKETATEEVKEPKLYERIKVDPALVAIAGLTVYMAIKSRRFIPIAGIVACPWVALMIEQLSRTLAARLSLQRNGKFVLPAIPTHVKTKLAFLGLAIVMSFGCFWGVKYYRVYLAPWPSEETHDYNPEKRDSVFMRMTASNVKPFDVCQFIRENNISGRMFNYWTEGGALAFGQTPDPKTGRTPLQLFMDGRAQAAYNHTKFRLWQDLYSGGPHAAPIRASNRFATAKEIAKIGKWLDLEMKKDKIWIFVLPSSQFARDPDPKRVNYYPLALPGQRDWRLVYIDDDQQMYVDISNPKGRKLLNDVFRGKAKFPNEYAKNVVLSKMTLSTNDAKYHAKGLDHAKKAFELNPSYVSAMTLVNIASGRYPNIKPDLRENARKYIEKYVDDFRKNNSSLKRESAYTKKLWTANVIASYLNRYYRNKNKQLATEYKTDARKWYAERKKVSYAARW